MLCKVVSTLCVCAVLGAASAARSQTDSTLKPIPGNTIYTAQETDSSGHVHTVPVVIFDAQPTGPVGAFPKPGFITPTPTLRDGGAVELRVYNPNSFLYSYDLSFGGVDYHTAAPPGALSGVLASTHGSRAATALTDPTLERDYDGFETAYAKEFGDPASATAGDAQQLQDSINTIVSAVTSAGGTNISIRAVAVDQVYDLVKTQVVDIGAEPTADTTFTIYSSHGPVSVTDFGPAQQAGLQSLLTQLRIYDTSTISADNATLKLWYGAWEKDYLPQPGPSSGAASKAAAGAPVQPAPPFTPTADEVAANQQIQEQMATSNALGDGTAALANLVALFGTAIDPSATPPYCEEVLYPISGSDVVRFTVTVEAKPPTGNFAQVDVENARIGIPGAASRTYTTEADVFGRTVLDLSAGLVLSTLKNRNYYFQGTSKVVEQGPSDSVDLSAGTIATLYKTQRRGIAFGPSLGASVGNGGRYLLGISAVGTIHRSRLVLTIGGMSGDVNELSGGFQVGKAYTGSSNSVTTSAVQRFGSFVALSWSIFTN